MTAKASPILQHPNLNKTGSTRYITFPRTTHPAHVIQSPAGWQVEHTPAVPGTDIKDSTVGWVYVRSGHEPNGVLINSTQRATRTTLTQENVTVPRGTHYLIVQAFSHLSYPMVANLWQYTVGMKAWLQTDNAVRVGMRDYVWLPEVTQGFQQKGWHNFAVKLNFDRDMTGTFHFEYYVKWASTRGELYLRYINLHNEPKLPGHGDELKVLGEYGRLPIEIEREPPDVTELEVLRREVQALRNQVEFLMARESQRADIYR